MCTMKTAFLFAALILAGVFYGCAQVKDVRSFTYDATPSLNDSIPCINAGDDRIIDVNGIAELSARIAFKGITVVSDSSDYIMSASDGFTAIVYDEIDNTAADTTAVYLPATVPYDGWTVYVVTGDLSTTCVSAWQRLAIRPAVGGDPLLTPSSSLTYVCSNSVYMIFGLVGRGYYFLRTI